jgi:DNA-3-methyladenine glycosylase II
MLPFDPSEAIAHLSEVDPILGAWIAKAGAFDLTLKPSASPWEGLTESIVYQQLSGKAAATIYGRFRALFADTAHPTPAQVLAFPDEILRSVGLSQNKMLAIKDLAQKTAAGIVPSMEDIHQMNDEDIKAALTQVRGIGEWTVEMLLMFNLGRPNVLPIHDLGVRKGFMLTYGLNELPKPKSLAEFGEKWRPFRSVASWYLWRATDNPDGRS